MALSKQDAIILIKERAGLLHPFQAKTEAALIPLLEAGYIECTLLPDKGGRHSPEGLGVRLTPAGQLVNALNPSTQPLDN